MLLYGVLPSHPRSAAEAHPPINITVSPNISPTFTNSPTITNSPEISPVQINEVAPQKAPSSEISKWGLEADLPEKRVFSLNANRWTISSTTGSQGLLVWVHNKSASDLYSVFASISYKEREKTLAHVSRAYWIGHPAAHINIEVQERKALLLGIFHERAWIAYQNQLKEMPWPPRGGFTIPRPLDHPFHFDSVLNIEVLLIRSHNGETLKKFDIEIRDIGEGEMKLTLRQGYGL